MAEIVTGTKTKGRKRLSTRIHLTPMVDLGFFADHLFDLHDNDDRV